MAEPMVDAEYLEQIAGARRELYRLMAKQNCAPIMLRLAWSDAGTYDVQSKTGGPNGSIRMAEEYTQAANLGLKIAIDMCEEVKSKHPKITYADLYQLAGVVAVAFCGGPTIDFIPGRQDSIVCSREGRLPDAKQGLQHLRDVFYRMGLSDKDTVALSGAHTLGRAHPERSGFDGPWTRKPLLFDNSYFMELQKKKETDGLLKLPTDKALVEDPEFHYHVRRYAESVSKFHKDYKKSHKKFSELGFNPSSVAAEDAVAAPDQNREVLQRIFERDVVKKRETGAIGLVLEDKVFPIAQAESFSLQPDALTLVDRTFRIGETVSRVGETVTKVGVVVAARKVVDLEDSDGDRLEDIQTDRIERIRGFFKDDLVIFESSWVGRVTATEFRFKLKFNNGGKMEWADPDPRALVPVFTNACEKVINVPYYLGQTVQKKPLKDDEPVVAGVVTLHKDRGLRVSWDEAERARSLCVPELVRATEVRRLMVPSAAHAGWMLGQRCLFNGEEYVICNVHPSTVTVRWKNGLEDEIEGRELVRADKPAGGFYEGSKFQIGQFVSRLEMGGLPNYGMVKGISGRCVKVEWEDGSIGTVDPEDIDIERGPDGEYYGGDTDEDGEEHGGDDADEEYGDGDRNADGSREEENDAGHAASDSEENGDWTSDEESDAVHIPSESEADSDDGGMVTESD